ncbi:MAG: hypothetical protein HQL63_12800 [Magnetococcales bacterium]|nr:hypothetical protein [Magnetococcales bacterium]MBF0322938.1 hypothetical protein [Magnetococcales bacterium]
MTEHEAFQHAYAMSGVSAAIPAEKSWYTSWAAVMVALQYRPILELKYLRHCLSLTE